MAENLGVAGVDDVWDQHADLTEALAQVTTSAAVVLLAHEPNYADTAAEEARGILQLSGHSHGRQVLVPFAEHHFHPR